MVLRSVNKLPLDALSGTDLWGTMDGLAYLNRLLALHSDHNIVKNKTNSM